MKQERPTDWTEFLEQSKQRNECTYPMPQVDGEHTKPCQMPGETTRADVGPVCEKHKLASPFEFFSGWNPYFVELQHKIRELNRLHMVAREGFGGVTKQGTLVDRREYPDAVPLQKNAAMGIPKPRVV